MFCTTMVRKMENMHPLSKLEFDDDDDIGASPSFSSLKSFSNDIEMEDNTTANNSNNGGGFSAISSHIKQPNGRLMSPRKPMSFKGYHASPTGSMSPPDKKVRALKLFDSPNTPKTLLQKSTQNTPYGELSTRIGSRINSGTRPTTRSRLFGGPRPRQLLPPMSADTTNIPTLSFDNTSSTTAAGVVNVDAERDAAAMKDRGDSSEVKNMRANVNPFTPNNIMLSSRKRARKARKLNSSRDDSFCLLNNNNSSKNHNSHHNHHHNQPHNSSFFESLMDQDDLATACSRVATSTNSSSSTTNNDCHHHHHMQQQQQRRQHSDYSSSSSGSSSCNNSDADDDSSSDDEDEDHPSKRIAIHEVNVSRYHKEYAEISLIGTGEYGGVYLCRHRLDGCLYAIKKSLKPVAGSATERTALNEVYAHAVLGAHQHVVRYYSAWAENDHMIIQNEYCNGGSLAQTIETNRDKGKTFTEDQIKTLLHHTAQGLKFIHSLHMVHLDVKPDNVFLIKEPCKRHHHHHHGGPGDGSDDGFIDGQTHTQVTYKIGDLGHVTSVMNPKVEEGDCRYLPRELLQEDYSALQKVDIFALGLTLFEAATGHQLPLNGEEWHSIRNGDLPNIPGFSTCLQDLLKLMIHNDPTMRPSASQLINHEVFNMPCGGEESSGAAGGASAACKTKVQLRRELEAARLRNEVLEKQLLHAHNFIQTKLSPCNSELQSPVPGGGEPCSLNGSFVAIGNGTDFGSSSSSASSVGQVGGASVGVNGVELFSAVAAHQFNSTSSTSNGCESNSDMIAADSTTPSTTTSGEAKRKKEGFRFSDGATNRGRFSNLFSRDSSPASSSSINSVPSSTDVFRFTAAPITSTGDCTSSSSSSSSSSISTSTIGGVTAGQQLQVSSTLSLQEQQLQQKTQQAKQYHHYNTRSHQQEKQRRRNNRLQQQQRQSARFVGRKADRSQGVM